MSWEEKNGKLYRRFTFSGFREAIAWMYMAAADIERLDHHPEWTNIYDKVDVFLCTHSAGSRVTEKDRELALILDRSYENYLSGKV